MSLIKTSVDLIYLEEAGDIVEALTRWHKHEDMISETSLTFSGQVFDFCRNNKLKTLAISAFPESKCVVFEDFAAYSQAKTKFGGGLSYHLSQVLYGLKIIKITLQHRAKYLHVTSGVTHWFVLAPLKLFGVHIVAQFHNTLWAKGYPPQQKSQRILLALNAWFLKHIASSAVCCSPEIQRQIEEITNHKSCPIDVFKAQFYRSNFEKPIPPPPHSNKPFQIVFAGRIEENKGVFDMLEMAKKLDENEVHFHICGGGTDLARLTAAVESQHLLNKITIHGKLKRPDLLEIYTQSHAVIVPTRSSFTEGLPLVAIESILIGRPIITSSLSNALDVLTDAIMEAQPENIESYLTAIQKLATDKTIYDAKQKACLSLREQFLDGKQGLTEILEKTLSK